MQNLEDLLAHIGNAHRFQLLAFIFIRGSVLFVSWTLYEMSFIKASPKWCCIPTQINTTSRNYCRIGNASFGDQCFSDDMNCTSRQFDDEMNTMVNEWDLVCEDEWKVNFSTSAQMVGVLMSNLITGYLTNSLGRKKTFYISVISLIILNLIVGFSNSWEMFTVLRILLGVSCGMFIVVSIPYVMEFLGPSRRDVLMFLPVYTLGIMIMAMVAYLLKDWQWLHWLCAALMSPLLLTWFFVPESLRWLTVKGRLDEAENIVVFIARVNGKEVPLDCRKVLEGVYNQEQKAKKTYHYIDLYRRGYFKISVILQIMWFLFSFCLFGVAFGVSTLGNNLYLNLLLLPAVGIPVQIMLQILSPKFGRKTMGLFLMFMGSLCGFISIAVHLTVSDEDTIIMIVNVLSLVANACVNGAWSVIILLNNESYPTVLRSLGYAASNTVSKIGGIVSPFAFDFKKMPILTHGLIGGSMGLCFILTLFMNETKGLDLPDTLEEARLARKFSSEQRMKKRRNHFAERTESTNENCFRDPALTNLYILKSFPAENTIA